MIRYAEKSLSRHANKFCKNKFWIICAIFNFGTSKDTLNMMEIINYCVQASENFEMRNNLFVFYIVHVVYKVREGKLKWSKIALR